MLWEMWLRPRLDQRNIARVLSSELELNEERLLVTQLIRAADRTRVLRHVNILTVALDAYRDRLSALDADALRLVMRLYWQLRHLETAAHSASDRYERYKESADGSSERAEHRRQIAEALEVFDSEIAAALATSETLRGHLYDLAAMKTAQRVTHEQLLERARAQLLKSVTSVRTLV